MSCLIDSGYKGSVTWLGRVMKPVENIRSEALKTAKSNFEVIVGESHSGTTRPACLRACFHAIPQKYRNSKHTPAFNPFGRRKCRKMSY